MWSHMRVTAPDIPPMLTTDLHGRLNTHHPIKHSRVCHRLVEKGGEEEEEKRKYDNQSTNNNPNTHTRSDGGVAVTSHPP